MSAVRGTRTPSPFPRITGFRDRPGTSCGITAKSTRGGIRTLKSLRTHSSGPCLYNHFHAPGQNIKGQTTPEVVRPQLYEIHLNRAYHIFHIAAANKVDILILGAFGCGAFANDPMVVAEAYRTAIIPYRARFDLIEFAIYSSGNKNENYDAFKRFFWMMTKDGERPVS